MIVGMRIPLNLNVNDSRPTPALLRSFGVVGWVLLLTCAVGNSVSAQEKNNRVANFIREALASRSKEIVNAAVDMPTDKFPVKVTPEGMTFGEFTLHVSSANYLYCSKIGNVADPDLPKLTGNETKDKLVERLKSSFDFCTGALARLDDSNKFEMLTLGDAKTPRSMAILTLSSTWSDHATQQVEYLQAAGAMTASAKK